MSRPIPPWLAPLRTDLDLGHAPSQPTGTARVVLVSLLAHAREGMVAWPGVKRLAWLADSEAPNVRRALRLLEHRDAIERVPHRSRCAWRVRLADTDPCARARVFWPLPHDWSEGDQTVAFRSLLPALRSRSRVAAAMMLYQFARPPEIPGLADDDPARRPWPANQAFVAGMLDMSESTVRRAKQDVIRRGLATEHAGGLLVFEDPGRWPLILNPSANGQEYPPNPRDPRALADAIADVERALASAGWSLPTDTLAHEIVTASVERWGASDTIARLLAELAGSYPSHALERLGAELGEEYECPHQLIPCSPAAVERVESNG